MGDSSPSPLLSHPHVPGEIDDPLTLYKIGKLNGYILYFEDVHQEMHPAYSLAIQEELDRTAAVSLPAKLDFFIGKEETRFLTHTLGNDLWQTYSNEPYFLPEKKKAFSRRVFA